MWSAVFCLASALDTFPSHLVQQESAYSSETCKSLCQNFSSGKEEMSKSEFNWSCFRLLKNLNPFSCEKRQFSGKLGSVNFWNCSSQYSTSMPRQGVQQCMKVHSQGQERESSRYLCYTALQKLVVFFCVTSFCYEGKNVILSWI